jgi:hypothetical protein
VKVDTVRFNGQLEIPGMASSSRYRITAAEGFAMTVTPLGVLARHDRRELDVLIPWARIDSADVLPEVDGAAEERNAAELATAQSPVKRKGKAA